MYITSELFTPPKSSYNSSSCHPQPNHGTMGDTQSLGKRKRGPDADEATNSTTLLSYSPAPKHIRLQTSNQASFTANRAWRFPFESASAPQHRPMKQLRRSSPSKRVTLSKSPSHLMDVEMDEPARPAPAIDLRPCHVCHKAPTRKRDLENYLDCKSCGERACYICARECVGGCTRHVCSKCCIEVGHEGDTHCLDCYQASGVAS
ncbi:hypothetical protein EJ04DRAFT_508876 [Polyplosphaeria fusca]|uniref:Uncharacterized protein n=1 Tax=Polyplosphaeria fusca TaxID=682080 RepID=A0A9P4R933_9PLEO|nr:hypothetical protein EJ04DRAFT_508876 [Polyplosphaeria fusca]